MGPPLLSLHADGSAPLAAGRSRLVVPGSEGDGENLRPTCAAGGQQIREMPGSLDSAHRSATIT